MTISFDAPVLSLDGRTIARLPADASAELPSRGQVAVSGTLNGREFSTVVEPDGARGHWIAVDPKLVGEREAVHAEISPVKAWPEPDIPSDFWAALTAAPDSLATWHDITPMARWEWVRWINSTRSPDTRARRVEVGLDKLRKGNRRPCCFDLASCTDPELSKNGKLLGLE